VSPMMPSRRPMRRPGQSSLRGTRNERGSRRGVCARLVISQREMEETDENKRVATGQLSPPRRFPIAVSAEEVGVLLQKARIKDVLILHMKDELCVVCTAPSRPSILVVSGGLSRNVFAEPVRVRRERVAAPSSPTPWSLARARRPGICTLLPMRYACPPRSPHPLG
jgi:hypothetical protein